MSDPAPVPPDPWWLKLVKDQHTKLALVYVLKLSGLASLPVLQRYFPGLTPDALATYIIAGLPFMAAFIIDWYRNNPNNIIKRALLVLNGPGAAAKVTEESKANVVEAVAQTVPGVKVKVDPAVASPAVVEMAKSQDNNVKMDKAA
jgi:hypothetical protein